MRSNAHGQKDPFQEVVEGVAKLHARCGHGEHIVGSVYGNEAFAKCLKCGILYCSVAVMQEINAARVKAAMMKMNQ